MRKKITTIVLAGVLIVGNTVPAFAASWHRAVSTNSDGKVTTSCGSCGASEVGVQRTTGSSTHGYAWVGYSGETLQSEVNVGGKTLVSARNTGWAQTDTQTSNRGVGVSETHIKF